MRLLIVRAARSAGRWYPWSGLAVRVQDVVGSTLMKAIGRDLNRFIPGRNRRQGQDRPVVPVRFRQPPDQIVAMQSLRHDNDGARSLIVQAGKQSRSKPVMTLSR